MSLSPVSRSARDRPKVVLVTVLIITTISATLLCQCDVQRRRRGQAQTGDIGYATNEIDLIDGFILANCGRFKPRKWQERQNAFNCEPFEPKKSPATATATASARRARASKLSEIQIQELPFYVQLIIDNGLYEINCSGTLIDYEFIITVARCAFEAKQIRVVLNTTNKEALFGAYGKVDKLCYLKDFHPDVNPWGDLAVLRLHERLNYSETIQPACLPQLGRPNKQAACLVARKPPSSSLVQNLQSHIVRRQWCPSNLTESYAHTCFQTDKKDLGFCKLELGTPVVCYDACVNDSPEVRAFVVGMESLATTPGDKCDPEVSTPLLYTDLNRMYMLIRSMTLTLINDKRYPAPNTVKCFSI